MLIVTGTTHYLTALNNVLPQITSAIGATIANKEIQEQLYAHNEVYETTLATLNQLIWELDLRNNTMRIMGFAPRIGTYNQQIIEGNYKNNY